jgi:hypothetical protein
MHDRVWVLVIDHRSCDLNVQVYTCYDHAYQSLYEYSLYDWDSAWGDSEELDKEDMINIAAEMHDFKWDIVETKIN